jgi:hypothetical protein
MLHQLKSLRSVQPFALVPICRLFRHNVESALEAVANIRQIDAPSTAIAHRSRCSFKRPSSVIVPWRCGTMTLAWLAFLCLVSSPCRAEIPDVLCNEGSGSFEAAFHTGVKVRVGAAKKGGLARRLCEAAMSWDQHNEVVATDAFQLDVDAFGVDLDVGVPVVTLQVKKSSADCCMTYLIYSLQKPSRLLRTITGGDFFSAADTDLDGRVEIWSHDAVAVAGFETFVLGELDAPPTIVLRFEGGRLLDVSSEFQTYFDSEIASIREKIDQHDLLDFKSSNGTLTPPTALSVEQLHRLRRVKARVLEIVWSYLYSGREQEAWRSLAEMWPAADVERIRTAVLDARTHGVRAEVDGVSTEGPNGKKKRVALFDATSSSQPNKSQIISPRPILLRRPPTSLTLPESELLLDLVIDSAGKVRSAEPSGKTKWADADLLGATAGWKFIPAFKGNRPVASRSRLAVSLAR